MHGSERRRPSGAAWGIVLLAVAVAVSLVAVPIASVFYFAFCQGFSPVIATLSRSETHAALGLSLLAAAVSVPFVAVFGLVAAWVVTRTEVRGRHALASFLDLPFAIPPVVCGLLIVLTLGPRSLVGSWLIFKGFPVVFAVPGVILATTLVSLAVVAKSLIPVLEALGPSEELAARSLGATPMQAFLRVTLPGLRLPLLHATISAAARQLGEFGSVSVVSGRIRGETMTVPLLIEALYGEYDRTGAFVLAALLSLMAIVTIVVKKWVEASFSLARTQQQSEVHP